MPLVRDVDKVENLKPAAHPLPKVYIALAITFSILLLALAVGLGYWRLRRHRSRTSRRVSSDRRCEEEEEVKDGMDDEHQVGTPRSPARITAVLNTPDSTFHTPPSVAFAIVAPDGSHTKLLHAIKYTPSPPPASSTADNRDRRSTPQTLIRSPAQPLESIEELDEEAAEEEEPIWQVESRHVRFSSGLTPSSPSPGSEATQAARTFEEAVQRFMNHMSDQRAFVQEHSVDARALNGRRSAVVEPVISMLAVPGEIDGSEDGDSGDGDQEDFVSFAWSYYGNSVYGKRFSTASDSTSRFEYDEDRDSLVQSPGVPQILVSAH